MTSTSLLPERTSAPVQPTARRRPLGALLATVAIFLGTPAAVHASYAEREDARAFAAEIAGRHALDAAEIERALAGARHDPEVIRLITPPARNRRVSQPASTAPASRSALIGAALHRSAPPFR